MNNSNLEFLNPISKIPVKANRLSSTIGGNREIDQLYTTSQVSNITRKTKFRLPFVDMFSMIKKKCKNKKLRTHKIALILL